MLPHPLLKLQWVQNRVVGEEESPTDGCIVTEEMINDLLGVCDCMMCFHVSVVFHSSENYLTCFQVLKVIGSQRNDP